MPLLDHFHPPLQLQYPWESFHSSWTTRLADTLNDQWLRPEFIAAEFSLGCTTFEIRVYSTTSSLALVAAIELIGPGNKDRSEERRAFAAKCAGYLYQGISLIIIDIVTNRRANLHNEI